MKIVIFYTKTSYQDAYYLNFLKLSKDLAISFNDIFDSEGCRLIIK